MVTSRSPPTATTPCGARGGAVGAGAIAVVKFQARRVPRAAPVASFTAAESVAAYVVPAARAVAGVNVAVAPAQPTLPATRPAPLEIWNDEAVTVAQSRARAKVAVTAAPAATPVTPGAGETETTSATAPAGGVPGATSVVKDQV